jgi:hypothetical protein
MKPVLDNETLTSDHQHRLAEILDAYMTQSERGEHVDRESLLKQNPELATHLRRYLEGIEFLQLAADELNTSDTTNGHDVLLDNQQLGDYRLIKEIGHGGMGVVYEARQLSLDRRVAIKILPFAAVLHQKQLARFTREAQAAAQLHHPHIVPVYAVGCERGVHYYSMQYIDGQTLECALSQSRRPDADGGPSINKDSATQDFCPADSRQVNMRPIISRGFSSTGRVRSTKSSRRGKEYHRNAVRLAIQASDALQHAHDYGVIHRDVKPSNLLIDLQGELWVTDFGVALLQSESKVTATGDVVGTLRYMSPEQATGQNALVDHRTDIYSLGVTLYELLTLRHPFEGVEQRELLHHIDTVEPRKPRGLDATIPVDLEKIVLKAIAKSRERRYQSAGEFTADMQRFLAGEPVLAKPPTLGERTARWASRHRTLVATCLLLVLVTLIATSAGAFLVAREHVKTRNAFVAAQRSERRAAERFQKAREVVDRLGTSFAQQLAVVPGTEPARAALLRETLHYYEEFVREASDDPSLGAELAKTHLKLGQIHEQIASADDALGAYQQAKELFGQLVAEHPDNWRHLRGLGLACNNIGLLLSQRSQAEPATAELLHALATHQQAMARWPADHVHQADTALVLSNLGLHFSAIDTRQAESYYARAVDKLNHILLTSPDDASVQSQLALVYNNLSRLHAGRDNDKAAEYTRRSFEIQQRLTERWPKNLRYQSDLALSLNNLGAFHKNDQQHDKARHCYERAIELQERLARKEPSVFQHPRDLAISYNNLGRLQHDAGKLYEGRRALEKSRQQLSQMIEREPRDVRYRIALAGVMSNLGACSEQIGDLDVALAAYQEAVQQQQLATQSAPGDSKAFDTQLAAYVANHDRVSRRLGKATAEQPAMHAVSLGHDNNGADLSTLSENLEPETSHAN